MNTSKRPFRFSAVSLAATSALWVISASTPTAQAQLAVTDLGNLGGTTSNPASYALGVNNSGLIVGGSYISDNVTTHAFTYADPGPMSDLNPMLGGSTNSAAEGVNDSGQIVGYADNFAFVYSGGTATNLGTLPTYIGSFATGINSSGQVSGEADSFTGGGYAPYQAFIYSGGTMTGLGTIGNVNGNSSANAINNAGQVVGYSDTAAGPQHAFLTTLAGPMTDLGTIGGVIGNSDAQAINNLGDVVGGSNNGTAYDAFLYDGTNMNNLTDLGNLSPAGGYSYAFGINDLGQVVGDSYLGYVGGDPNNPIDRAFIYQNGAMTDLNSLTVGSGWVLEEALAINNSGEIVGYGIHNGQVDAFELQVPEPGSIAILAVGAVGLLKRRGRRSV